MRQRAFTLVFFLCFIAVVFWRFTALILAALAVMIFMVGFITVVKNLIRILEKFEDRVEKEIN